MHAMFQTGEDRSTGSARTTGSQASHEASWQVGMRKGMREASADAARGPSMYKLLEY